MRFRVWFCPEKTQNCWGKTSSLALTPGNDRASSIRQGQRMMPSDLRESERRSVCLAARRLGETFFFPPATPFLHIRISRSDRTLCVVRPAELPAPLLTKTRRWGFRTKLHFFRTAIVLPISALCFLPNPEFKTACAMCSRNTRQRILIF